MTLKTYYHYLVYITSWKTSISPYWKS